MKILGVDTDREVLVIAEVGNNHEGDFGRAREMVEAAAESGAHAVKFQTFRVERFISRDEGRRFDQLAGFELAPEQFAELAELARKKGVAFVSTALDLESAALLEEIADAIKIASGDNTFYPLIRRVAEGRRPILISAGMARVELMRTAVGEIEAVRGSDDARLGILHCVSAYPAPADQLNLRAIGALRQEFPHAVGYSDHAIGNTAAVAAVALGARIVEKHFTLEGIESDFGDHALSATPAEMKALVDEIGLVGSMLGSAEKEIAPAEEPVAAIARRSIHARRDLAAGEIVAEADLDWLRPPGGLAPGEEDQVVGRELAEAVRAGERILPRHVR